MNIEFQKDEISNALKQTFIILDNMVEVVKFIDKEISDENQVIVYNIIQSLELTKPTKLVDDFSVELSKKIKSQKFGIVEGCIIEQLNKTHSLYNLYKLWYAHKDVINQLCVEFQIDSKLFDIFNEMTGIEEVNGGQRGGGGKNKFLLALFSLFLFVGMFIGNVFNIKNKANDLNLQIVNTSKITHGALSVTNAAFKTDIPGVVFGKVVSKTPIKKLLGEQSIIDSTKLVNQFLDNIVAPEERTSIAQQQESLFLSCNANGGMECVHLAKFQLINGILGLVQGQDRLKQTNGVILVVSKILDTLISGQSHESKFIQLLSNKLAPGLASPERESYISTKIVKALSLIDNGTLVTFQDVWNILPILKPSMDNAISTIEKMIGSKDVNSASFGEKELSSLLTELKDYEGIINVIDDLHKNLNDMGFKPSEVAISISSGTSPGGIMDVFSEHARQTYVDPLDPYFRGGKSKYKRTKRNAIRKRTKRKSHKRTKRKPKLNKEI